MLLTVDDERHGAHCGRCGDELVPGWKRRAMLQAGPFRQVQVQVLTHMNLSALARELQAIASDE